MEGFIYIWYDRKRNMYYIGCHWGTEDDGYICSNNRMRDAYRRRPNDFRRRIIQKGITRENLLEEEYKWLQLVPDDQLGKKYYNLRKHKWGHWSTDENSKLSISEKISQKNKGRTYQNRKKPEPFSEEHRKNMSIGKMGNTNSLGRKLSKEHRQKISESNRGKTMSIEVREKISKTLMCHPVSLEARKKISESNIQRYKHSDKEI